ncbi:hypothetical protein [Gallaecimonas mangrovi]|uniref:hypothetical protein n=1 Tax=Gallaecimonas mangrovi TaxID=2291597 RepID=UPI000E2080B1|nr:hypothetical protein [Gallaecimonas mangrovi]
MAIIHCYACGKRISDKAPSCPHCGQVRSDDPEAVAQGRARQKALKVSKYNNGSMLALLSAGLGFLILWVMMSHPELAKDSRPTIKWVGDALLAIGLTGYVACRVMAIWHKRKGG